MTRFAALTSDKPNPLELGLDKQFNDLLKEADKQLEQVITAINDFLEIQKDAFPKFNFVSDEDIFRLIRNYKNLNYFTENPTLLDEYFLWCFTIGFNKDVIHSVISP